MQILSTPTSKRNTDWEKSFLKTFPTFDLYLKSDEPFQGPDAFSYMDVTTEKTPQKIKLEDFLAWCGHAGVGIVLNLKSNKTPDYVFNYGMIWNYLLRKTFINSDSKKTNIEDVKTLLVHKILEGYLPQYVRQNISDFLVANKIEGAKIGLISKGDNTPYEILWYFPKNQDLSEEDEKTLLESISWFLPLDYNVAMVMKDDPSLHLENL